MSKVIITQSNYIPWKGYFDMIESGDHCVLYDDMQYTKRDWRNRNKIKTPNGTSWLSIPVEVKGKYFQRINETKISDPDWGTKHWNLIAQNYRKTKYFSEYKDIFEPIYRNQRTQYLSQINFSFIEAMMAILKIDTQLHWSSDFVLQDGKTEKLLGICKDLNAKTYISGPAAKDYLDVDMFNKENVSVEWMDYSGYPEYNQLYPPFEHGVTLMDLLFNEGPAAQKFMKITDK